MGSIELRITLLAGAVAGVIMLLAELIAMHSKVAKYRDHLRGLYRSGRFMRLLSECIGILVVTLIQPVVVSVLLLKALDNFDPRFSANAVQQLKNGVKNGNLEDERKLRGEHEEP
jgi:hypothetical protein